jgi:hypothetical protein
MQSENQVCPRNLLHIFDDGGVALIHRDELIHPMEKWMGSGRRDLEPVTRGEFR